MKRLFTVLCALIPGATLMAQSADPVLMTVNGQPVLRSEFEYSYNKNNSDGVIDKKTVDEYVDLFINYKLKVAAALDERLDTLTSFQQEFAQYRDQQVRPALVTDADLEAEAHNVYDATVERIGPDGLVQAAHILIRLPQQVSEADKAAAKVRIDSVYQALKQGADFETLARQVSQDPGSAQNGGLLPYAHRGQFFKEFEDVAFALQNGELSKPVESPVGWHVILKKDQKMLEPYDFHRANILQYLEQRGMRERIAERKLDDAVKASGSTLTKEQLLTAKTDSLAAADPELKNLIREYHDGLLLYEISNRLVWEKGATDEAGLARFFKAHRAKYNWSEPRFKGMAYHVKEQTDVKAVKNSVKKVPFGQWADVLRQTFNPDSVIRIRVEKGLFKAGDNALVDREVFHRDTTVTPVKDYPIDVVYGKLLKKGPEDYTDVRGQVVADYQDELEREWVAELRRRYTFEVNRDVLATVNQH